MITDTIQPAHIFLFYPVRSIHMSTYDTAITVLPEYFTYSPNLLETFYFAGLWLRTIVISLSVLDLAICMGQRSRSTERISSYLCNCFAPSRVAKYCDEYVCLSVRPPVTRNRAAELQHFLHFACGRGSVLLWRRCNKLCFRFYRWRHVFVRWDQWAVWHGVVWFAGWLLTGRGPLRPNGSRARRAGLLRRQVAGLGCCWDGDAHLAVRFMLVVSSYLWLPCL